MSPHTFNEQLEGIIGELDGILSEQQTLKVLQECIVNCPFRHPLFMTSLDIGIIVLLRVNDNEGMIDRIALSSTSLASGAVRASAKPFSEIRIPVDNTENIIAKAIREKTSYATEDWQYLFTPALTDQEARRNQMGASIECSIVYPLECKPAGGLIFSFYQPERNLDEQHSVFMVAYSRLVEKHLRRFSQGSL